jgi:hypothetical protein
MRTAVLLLALCASRVLGQTTKAHWVQWKHDERASGIAVGLVGPASAEDVCVIPLLEDKGENYYDTGSVSVNNEFLFVPRCVGGRAGGRRARCVWRRGEAWRRGALGGT